MIPELGEVTSREERSFKAGDVTPERERYFRWGTLLEVRDVI